MVPIPLTTFDGYLKRTDSSQWEPSRRALFSYLFPVFADEGELTTPADEIEDFYSAFKPFIEINIDLAQPRRFSGAYFPRSRYFSVCMDEHGDDQNTLVHELRAYRDPARSGMVEVMDLGIGERVGLTIGQTNYPLEKRPEIAVLVHDLDKIPDAFHKLAVRDFEADDGTRIWMFCFPYLVEPVMIEGVVDLRLPETRERFYVYFSKPQEGIIWPEQESGQVESITALSRFHLLPGRAPIPKDFYHMLPTLMNPDIGGGQSSSTGSTVQAIGQWMRTNGVSALIYPSARCDVYAEIHDGKLRRFGGWNLVDYRSIELDDAIEGYYFDHSPWCWVRLPEDVSIGIAPPDSLLAGTFQVQGMVNYWARDYLEQVRSLQTLDTVFDTSSNAVFKQPEISFFETWNIGVYLIRWFRLAMAQCSQDELRTALRIQKGLSIRRGLFNLTGELDDVMAEFMETNDLNKVLRANIAVSSKLAEHFESRAKSLHAEVVVTANNLELFQVYLVLGVRGQRVPDSISDIRRINRLPLSGELKQRLSAYMKETAGFIAGAEGSSKALLSQGQVLEQNVSDYLRKQQS